MRHNLLCAIVLVLVVVGSDAALSAASPHEDWINALKPKGEQGPELTLASGGKTDYVVLLPAAPTSQDENAAEELVRWLGEMTGAEFRTVREGEAGLTVGKAISVGRTELLEESKLPGASEDLGDEGYAIAVQGENLFLFGGRNRGPIYAVFALLEEDLGCRWYARETSTIPQISELKFRPVLRSFVPVLQIRDPFYWDAFHETWSLRNRTNAPRAGVREQWGGHVNYPSGWFVHTFDALVSPAEYFEEHPEYFSEIDGKRIHHIGGHRPGQLCLTNPDVLRISIDRVLEVLKNNPNAEIISVSENDGRAGYCRCENCEAINKAEGSPAGTLIKFVNAVADAVAREYPDVKVGTLAYGTSFMPPKTIRPRDNVVVRLCTDMHAWGNPFLFVTETEKFQAALKGWAEMGARISIWDYTIDFGAYMNPWPNMPVVAENMRTYIAHNAVGIMLQGAYQSPGGDRAPMRSWVWAKQLWDASLDTRALIRDFNYGYYGSAAVPLQEYSDLLWRTWEHHHDGPEKGKGYPIDREFVEKALGLFERAEELADDDETLSRVKVAKLSVLFARLTSGPDPSAVKQYLAMVDEFESTARANGVTHLRESPAGIEEHLMRWRSQAGRLLVKLDVPGTVYADDIEPRLAYHLGAHSPKLVEDRLAENGCAIRQPGGNTQWSIQWAIPVADLEPEQKYLLRARMRVDKKGDEGPAFHAGVYNGPKRSYPVGTKGFTASELSADEYRWCDIGELVPEEGCLVYIAPDDNVENVTAVYTDRIELVPVEESE